MLLYKLISELEALSSELNFPLKVDETKEQGDVKAKYDAVLLDNIGMAEKRV